MNPQTIDIEAFIEVVEKGSFGRAAGSMLVSQPSISDRIARLERAVGAGLFARRARGVVLTPAGERSSLRQTDRRSHVRGRQRRSSHR